MSQSRPRHVVPSQGRGGPLKAKSAASCQGCAERRILCDKSLPNCLRCTSDGLLCNFPSGPHSTSQASVKQKLTRSDTSQAKISQELSALSLSTSTKPSGDEPKPQAGPRLWNASSSEVRSTQFYSEVTVRAFTAFNPGAREFHTICVLQLSLQEPLIRFLMLSIAKAHEATFTGSQDAFTQSLSFLGAALQESMKLTSQPSKAQVVLVSCQLFYIIYLLHDNEAAAGQHIRFGIELLKQWNNSSTDSRIQMNANSILYTRAGSLLHVYESEHTKGPSKDAESKKPKQSILETIQAKMYALSGSLVQTSDLDDEIAALNYQYSYLMDILPWTESTNAARLQWSQTLDCYFEFSSLASRCQTEIDWDDHNGHIRILLSKCVDLLNQETATGLSRSPGPLPVLYQIALKCRDLRMRATAIELMKRHCHKRGIARPFAIVVAECVVRLEDSIKSQTTGAVPERNRFQVQSNTWSTGDGARVTLAWYPYRSAETIRVNAVDLGFVVFDLAQRRLKIE